MNIELRYVIRVGQHEKVLQYRKYMDTSVRAGLNWSVEDLAKTAKYEWSDWIDVPVVPIMGLNDD
jgi:hypothetical protein